MPFKLSQFVFWSGVYNAGLALFLLFPPFYQAFGLNICAPVWGWLISGFLAFTSAVLILASRDLGRRAPLVYWEFLLRYAAAMGLGDLAIGVVYMFGLPKELGVSHQDLLFDRLD
jgi:hypothetical protein